ncbi:hypothetical protein KRX51_09220 [Corynebacterium sp. TAE3-ERU12]|uniref:hypothetical protein n=1 Tax=Corynebacterium sp. TAE3-ERU12 TaxID=2849491 RepID=UPI001C46D81B|nr:hypothetical protein [Corynebacterium sp. TAE3-ERU12]MBV7296089.1 hypothetical protein [Corynebacterium sp. TAE3-ERU12]
MPVPPAQPPMPEGPRLGGVYVGPNYPAPGPYGPMGVPTPPRKNPTESAIGAARTAGAFAVGTVVAILITVLAYTLAHTSPNNDPLLSVLFTPMHSVLRFIGVATGLTALVCTFVTLAALRRRAVEWDPPLARARGEITRAHFVPGLNITGVIQVLAETGIRGRFSYAWFASYLLFPITVVLFFWATTVSETIVSGTVGVINFGCWAIAMFSLADDLTEATVNYRVRPVVVPEPDPAFWERGMDPHPRPRGATIITPPLSDDVDRFYIS